MQLRPRLLAGTAALVAVAAGLPAQAGTPQAPAVIELATPRPAWFTEALEDEVFAAGERGVPIPQAGRKDIPMSGLGFTGIRPGTWILSPAGCTANFVFQSNPGPFTTNQTLYFGTAGHCAGVGQRVTVVAACPSTSTPALLGVGTVVVSNNNGVGDDFALIQIDSRFNNCVSPSMAHWGGPTGTYTSNTITQVVHSGHGIVLGTGGTPRAGTLRVSDARARYWLGSVIFGDSGSGVNTLSGLAIANVTHLSVVGPGLSTAIGTRIERILTIAGKHLSTCPTRTPWASPGCPPV